MDDKIFARVIEKVICINRDAIILEFIIFDKGE